MRYQIAITQSEAFSDVDSSQEILTNPIDFRNYNDAHQMELKFDVTAGDGTVAYQMQASDDGTTWFDIEDGNGSVIGEGKDGIYASAIGVMMRAKITYTHNTTDTSFTVFSLVR